ncbi:MAG TPA: DUF1329 domain-containing protein, partial [Rhodocyclaceae bacterium]|nr:DUF1329 domain-containing protein [Rhodocyclaceae bacterium]
MKTKFVTRPLLFAGLVACAFTAHAGVTPDEAAQLKSTLTPMGAEKAGNKDGSIPAWTPVTAHFAGYKPDGSPRPDSFA